MQRTARLVKWTFPLVGLLFVGLLIFSQQLPISNAAMAAIMKPKPGAQKKITCTISKNGGGGQPNPGVTLIFAAGVKKKDFTSKFNISCK
jgi:hypothetical protein